MARWRAMASSSVPAASERAAATAAAGSARGAERVHALLGRLAKKVRVLFLAGALPPPTHGARASRRQSSGMRRRAVKPKPVAQTPRGAPALRGRAPQRARCQSASRVPEGPASLPRAHSCRPAGTGDTHASAWGARGGVPLARGPHKRRAREAAPKGWRIFCIVSRGRSACSVLHVRKGPLQRAAHGAISARGRLTAWPLTCGPFSA